MQKHYLDFPWFLSNHAMPDIVMCPSVMWRYILVTYRHTVTQKIPGTNGRIQFSKHMYLPSHLEKVFCRQFLCGAYIADCLAGYESCASEGS